MSTNKEQKFFVGVLSILAAAILGHPTAEAAQVLQTAAEETSSVKSNAVEARERSVPVGRKLYRQAR